jgi:hypothetical protein
MESIDKYVPDFINILTEKHALSFNNYLFLLAEDNIYVNSNPFISTLMFFYIKYNINVILCLSQESLHHYSTIAKKFGINLNNSDKFCCIDLFYSPIKRMMNEELPLSESFPYTYNPNRSKIYYTNVTLNNKKELSFDNIINNIESAIKIFNNNLKTVVIFDNVSTLPITSNNLYDEINLLVRYMSDNVIILY